MPILRYASSRRASTSSVVPGRISKSSNIRGPRSQGPRHADFRGPRTQPSRHTVSKDGLLRHSSNMGDLCAFTTDRRKRRGKQNVDFLANQLSNMNLSPPPPTMGSLLEKLDKMEVDPDTTEGDPDTAKGDQHLSEHPSPPTPHHPFPISSHTWLKITFLSAPQISTSTSTSATLQSICLPLPEAPTLRALQTEILRTLASTHRVRRRAIPLPDSYSFRVITRGYLRTFWIGRPTRHADLLVDGEPIYQAFVGECGALGEEERARLEAGMMETKTETEDRLSGTGGGGGGSGRERRQRKQVNRIVQMVGQGQEEQEPVVLARAWASCEVSFPPVEEEVGEMELDDLPI